MKNHEIVKYIKELQREIEQLKARVDTLEIYHPTKWHIDDDLVHEA